VKFETGLILNATQNNYLNFNSKLTPQSGLSNLIPVWFTSPPLLRQIKNTTARARPSWWLSRQWWRIHWAKAAPYMPETAL